MYRKTLAFFLATILLTAVVCVYPVQAVVYSGSFTIDAPGGGDILQAGSTYTIEWTYTGNLGETVNLALYKGNNTRSVIILGTPIGSDGQGSYSWKIPAGVPDGSDYQVKILCSHNTKIIAFSDYFSVTRNGTTQQQDQTEDENNSQDTQAGTRIIDDPSFVTLTAAGNPQGGADSPYNLTVKANNASTPVEVSYLVLNPNATPDSPSQGIAVSQLTESEASWGGSQQYYGHTEVGGWAQPQYQKNPQTFALPHYRTCVMMLARYEKIYVVFIRENDGQLTYKVFQGGAFNGLEVPGLGQVVQKGDQLLVHSLGGAVELGIWDKGTYKRDEVTGWAQASYQANDKLYPIPKYGMFMMAVGRYGKLGLIMGNYNDGRLGTVCFAGSDLLGTQAVPGLCEITNAGAPHIRARATGGDPVEVSQFAFDNTCWQWEVGGWGQAAFKPNPQILPLKHYTPGFFTCSRYDKAGIFFYNENDSQMGVLPLNNSTQISGSRVVMVPTQSQTPASSGSNIRVFLNGHQLTFDQPPVIINGSTLVPMRVIFEALGATVDWNGTAQSVTASDGSTTIILIIGLPTARVNGHEGVLSQPAQIIGGRTMVPLRFVAESMQCEVNWDGPTRTITITSGTSEGSTEQTTGKQAVDAFFGSLARGTIDAAMALMDGDLLGNAASQEMWRNSFASFETLQGVNIQDWNAGDWSSTWQIYRVDFTLQLRNGTPESGWTAGGNTRWVSVKKTGGQWKISELATGP